MQVYLSQMLYSSCLLLPKASVSRSLLCYTLAGRRVDVLTITDAAASATAKHKYQLQEEQLQQQQLESQDLQLQQPGTCSMASPPLGRAGSEKEQQQVQAQMQQQGQEEEQQEGQQDQRQVVLIMARVHPGETCASWVMKVRCFA